MPETSRQLQSQMLPVAGGEGTEEAGSSMHDGGQEQPETPLPAPCALNLDNLPSPMCTLDVRVGAELPLTTASHTSDDNHRQHDQQGPALLTTLPPRLDEAQRAPASGTQTPRSTSGPTTSSSGQANQDSVDDEARDSLLQTPVRSGLRTATNVTPSPPKFQRPFGSNDESDICRSMCFEQALTRPMRVGFQANDAFRFREKRASRPCFPSLSDILPPPDEREVALAASQAAQQLSAAAAAAWRAAAEAAASAASSQAERRLQQMGWSDDFGSRVEEAARKSKVSWPTEEATRFNFTIRKADDSDMGLCVSHVNFQPPVIIDTILPGGAVDSWNKLCVGDRASRAVMQGDHLLSANGITDVMGILEEMMTQRLLRVEVWRPAGRGCSEVGVLSSDEQMQ
eukprot:TRINITY_DN49228_c0_g1_i1.p1 TRINITY_DN49228_c0_g1~~TRINITY_DN49228_c0_g1_i1.p1  ORF type:complete len:416 (+),score=84.47 TRINITY_DN49228_c0_g1_i1:54-1250(+)